MLPRTLFAVFSLCATLLVGSQTSAQIVVAFDAPADRSAVASEDPMDAVLHSGTVELSPAEALRSARQLADNEHREILVRHGADLASRSAPTWLPGLYVDRVVESWVMRLERSRSYEIVDRGDVVRDHGFGPSFQTELLVRHPAPSARDLRTLGWDLKRIQKRFLAACGGSLVLWSVLALAFWWLDRLTRGYMSVRLASLAVLCGLAVPAVGFTAI